MMLSDVVEQPGPIDPFKTVYNKKVVKGDVADKVNLIVHHKPKENDDILAELEGPGIKKAHNYKWTTVENQFTRKKKRLFDELPEA
jgi:hypothetical protein